MTNKNRLQTTRPGIFSPSLRRDSFAADKSLINKTNDDLTHLSIGTSDYFLYNAPGTGIKNTQQLPIDFSKFENHTFFSSAKTNVNVAFDNIINKFPFDGTRIEYEEYLSRLTGFEKYVLEKFPKNLGYLIFSGSSSEKTTEGTYIKVDDFEGAQFPDFSKNKTGQSILNPGEKSYTLECVVKLRDGIANENQILFQKISGSNMGFTLAVSQSASTTSANILFGVTSGSVKLFTSASVTKGSFNHLAAAYDRSSGINRLKLFVNTALASSSSLIANMKNIEFDASPFLIGSGTTHAGIAMSGDNDFIPTETYSGSLDEVRFYHKLVSDIDLKKFENKNVFPSEDLKLYFKFNEPSASFGNNALILDSSGNGLHSTISNYVASMRETGSFGISLSQENRDVNPVLFPLYEPVSDLNVDLLSTGTTYDEQNPNLITKLVPPHYFDEGFNLFGFYNFDAPVDTPYSGSNMPGSGELGSAQIMSALLFVWAKHFDEIKTVTDHMSVVSHVGYDDGESAADQFLPFVSKYFGFELPPIFTDANPEQFYHNQNQSIDYSNNSMPLMAIRNKILRRILTNIGETIRSKGTVHSVKTIIRSFGLDPDIYVRIKEFGGPKKFTLSDLRYDRAIITSMLNFSGSKSISAGTKTAQGVYLDLPHVRSRFLSGSRIEVGDPEAAGTFVQKGNIHQTQGFGLHGISNNPDDGLFTSGSWTFEGTYKFPDHLDFPISSSLSYPASQSLARLHVTGSGAPSWTEGLVANMLLMSGSEKNKDGHVKLWVRNNLGAYNVTTQPALEMTIPYVSVSNGETWNFSFGRERAQAPVVSSSYFLRCARQTNGKINHIFTTSSFYLEDPAANFESNAFQHMKSNLNSSGTFIAVGKQVIATDNTYFLNNSNLDDQARETSFEGTVSNIKFWSKALSVDEWKEHVRNPRSLGVANPDINFNFVTQESGSFERLRMNLSCDQPVTMSNSSGEINLIDFTQNELSGSGTGFESSKDIFVNNKRFISAISPNFDENLTSEKVRPRSFKNQENIDEYNASLAPLHEIPWNEEPQDDPRFSLEFSVADALNEDIANIFSSLNYIDNAIGDPTLMYSEDYPDLETLRDIYFNSLTEKINFKKFFEFYKWFDTSIGVMIEQLMPKKANFLGVNFVIEPHSLERAKLRYHNSGNYTIDNIKPGDTTTTTSKYPPVADPPKDNPPTIAPNTYSTPICTADYGNTLGKYGD